MQEKQEMPEQMTLFTRQALDWESEKAEILHRAGALRAATLADMVSGFLGAVAAVFRARRTARALDELSDTVLADIGITREQIPTISRALADGTYRPAPAPEVIRKAAPQPAAPARGSDEPEFPLAA